MNKFQEQVRCELHNKAMNLETELQAALSHSCGSPTCLGMCRLARIKEVADDSRRIVIAAQVLLPEKEVEKILSWSDEVRGKALKACNNILEGIPLEEILTSVFQKMGAEAMANSTPPVEA